MAKYFLKKSSVIRPKDFVVLTQETETFADTSDLVIRWWTVWSSVFVNWVDSTVDVASKDTTITLDTSWALWLKKFDVRLKNTAWYYSNPVMVYITKTVWP